MEPVELSEERSASMLSPNEHIPAYMKTVEDSERDDSNKPARGGALSGVQHSSVEDDITDNFFKGISSPAVSARFLTM